MTDVEYEGWVVNHCEATAASVEAVTSLLAPVTRRVFLEWGPTVAELGECTYRMIAAARVPKFANEHAEAVARELMALRRERAEAVRPALSLTTRAADCALCADSGLVVVPHWRCVEVPRADPPRLVAYRDENVAYRSVVEVSVRCDAAGCAAGRRQLDSDARLDEGKRRMGLTTYLGRIGGALSAVSVLRMLREHNTAIADRARLTGGDSPFAGVLAELLRKVSGDAHGEAA